MLVQVTKKEFDSIKNALVKVADEFKEVDSYVPEWAEEVTEAKLSINHKEIRYVVNENGVDLYISEDLMSDIITIIYEPTFVTVAKWFIETYKTFKKFIEKVLKPACDFITGKYELDDIEINYGDEDDNDASTIESVEE